MRRTIIRSTITLAAFAATFGVGVLALQSDGSYGDAATPPAGTTGTAAGPAVLPEPANPAADGLPAEAPRDLEPGEDDAPDATADPADNAEPGAPVTTLPVELTTPVVPRPERTPDAVFPTVNPLRVDGATDTYYIAANDPQASIYGLPPGSVRTWGMDLTASSDPAADHARIVAGLEASGFAVVNDEMADNPGGTTGRITGDYKGWTFAFVVLNRQSATLSLLDW